MALPSNKIPVLEQFVTIQGEGRNVGVPYYFIRVGGCPLRCNFCDSEYTWVPKQESICDVEDVVRDAIAICKNDGIEWISITGGEPLIYPEQLVRMLEQFNMSGLKTHVETSGRYYDRRIHLLCTLYSPDAKTPCTGEQTPDDPVRGSAYLRDQDQVKCLIQDDVDLDYAYELNQKLDGVCPMILQPFNTQIPTKNRRKMSANVSSEVLEKVPDITRLRRALLVGTANLIDNYQKRCNSGEKWKRVIITPQLHVLLYGNVPNR